MLTIVVHDLPDALRRKPDAGSEFFLDNRFVLSLVYASSSLSFSIYLLSGYFKTLPKGYEEAAYIDGCGYFKTMVKIMIPMAKPSISPSSCSSSCPSGMSTSSHLP